MDEKIHLLFFALAAAFVVEFRIEGVEISAVQLLLHQPQAFAEPLVVDDLPFPQEADGVADFRVFHQTENVVVGGPGFLFWGDFVRTTLHNII